MMVGLELVPEGVVDLEEGAGLAEVVVELLEDRVGGVFGGEVHGAVGGEAALRMWLIGMAILLARGWPGCQQFRTGWAGCC